MDWLLSLLLLVSPDINDNTSIERTSYVMSVSDAGQGIDMGSAETLPTATTDRDNTHFSLKLHSNKQYLRFKLDF